MSQENTKRDKGRNHVHVKLPTALFRELNVLLDGHMTKQNFFEDYARAYVENQRNNPQLQIRN